MGSGALAKEPKRAPVWLLGNGHGIQVWTIDVDPRIRASVLIGEDGPMILLNRRIADTSQEGAALHWAFARIAAREPGFYVLRD